MARCVGQYVITSYYRGQNLATAGYRQPNLVTATTRGQNLVLVTSRGQPNLVPACYRTACLPGLERQSYHAIQVSQAIPLLNSIAAVHLFRNQPARRVHHLPHTGQDVIATCDRGQDVVTTYSREQNVVTTCYTGRGVVCTQ